MKILFITQNLPYPPDSGGKIKTYETIKLLAKKHKIFLACFLGNKDELRHTKKLEKLGLKVFIVYFPQTVIHFSKMRKFMGKSLFSTLPFLVYRHRNKEMMCIISEILKKESIDAIHIDHLTMAQYLPKKKEQIWVYDEHNIDSQTNWQIFQRAAWNKFKLFSLQEWIRMVVYEKRTIPRFDYCLSISKKDRKKLISLGAKEERALFYPIYYEGKKLWQWKENRHSILFAGSLAWWPNQDGLLWFIDKVLPLIANQFPQVRLKIIGRDDSDKLANHVAGNSCVELLGYVKDLTPHLKSAGVVIIPLRAGSGIRIKALTAMGAGVPVLSTNKGIEGLEVRHEREVIIADTPKAFSKAAVDLLTKSSLAKSLSKNGMEFVEKRYNKQNAQKVLENIYGKFD